MDRKSNTGLRAISARWAVIVLWILAVNPSAFAKIAVSLAVHAQRPAILALEKKLVENPWDERSYIEATKKMNSTTLVVYESESYTRFVRGFSVYDLYSTRIVIKRFVVDSDYWGLGHADAMMATLKQRLSHRRRRSIVFDTEGLSDRAWGFLIKHGFRLIDLDPFDPQSHTMLVYNIPLESARLGNANYLDRLGATLDTTARQLAYLYKDRIAFYTDPADKRLIKEAYRNLTEPELREAFIDNFMESHPQGWDFDVETPEVPTNRLFDSDPSSDDPFVRLGAPRNATRATIEKLYYQVAIRHKDNQAHLVRLAESFLVLHTPFLRERLEQARVGRLVSDTQALAILKHRASELGQINPNAVDPYDILMVPPTVAPHELAEKYYYAKLNYLENKVLLKKLERNYGLLRTVQEHRLGSFLMARPGENLRDYLERTSPIESHLRQETELALLFFDELRQITDASLDRGTLPADLNAVRRLIDELEQDYAFEPEMDEFAQTLAVEGPQVKAKINQYWIDKPGGIDMRTLIEPRWTERSAATVKKIFGLAVGLITGRYPRDCADDIANQA